MITVVSQTSEEYQQEIKEMFEKIKPLLDEGYSYSRSMMIVTGENRSIHNTALYKHVCKYGESQGYSKKTYAQSRRKRYAEQRPYRVDKDKHGLYNVILISKPQYLTGYTWMYYYFEEGVRRTLSSKNLKELRVKVEDAGLLWKVTDLELAKNAYDFNEWMQSNARAPKRTNRYGIKNVSKHKCDGCKQGFNWEYNIIVDGVSTSVSAVDLNKLKLKVLNKGLDWVVFDVELAKSNGLEVE